jgi:hypothetical protein
MLNFETIGRDGKFFVTSGVDRLHCPNGCTQMTKKGDGAIGI